MSYSGRPDKDDWIIKIVIAIMLMIAAYVALYIGSEEVEEPIPHKLRVLISVGVSILFLIFGKNPRRWFALFWEPSEPEYHDPEYGKEPPKIRRISRDSDYTWEDEPMKDD